MRAYYAVSKVPPTPQELDTLNLFAFDDRTLATLIGRASNELAERQCTGVDNDNPYRALPLERWRDR